MKPSFVVDDAIVEYEDDQVTKSTEDNESDDEEDLYDVCAICDNGGDLTCCEGKCLRSFHATVESAESADSNCKSLGLPAEEVKGSKLFYCLNCSHEQHQCFVCGKLGSSNESSGAEVFCCISASCGHFYHPHCVAKLLANESDTETLDLEEKIAAGEPFLCPAHKCHKCKLGENERVEDLQFAMCRRCPSSYHRKCLPSEIVFHNEDNDEDVIARAWNGLLPKSRALIFCFKHKMDHKLGTAVRNIKFPEIDHNTRTVAVTEEVVNSDHTSDNSSSLKLERRVEKSSSFVRPVRSSKKRVTASRGSEAAKKHRVTESYKKVMRSHLDEPSCYKDDHIRVDEDEQTLLDAGSQERIVEVMKKVNSSINLDMDKLTEYLAPVLHETQYPSSGRHLSEEENVKASDLQVENREFLHKSCSRTNIVNGHAGNHQDFGFSSGYVIKDASSYNRSSTSVIQSYAPKLDELNHIWMKNRSTWVYDCYIGPQTDSSSFAHEPYDNSSCGWLDE